MLCPSPISRVAAIARNALSEAIRQRLTLLLALLSIGFVAGGAHLRDFNFGASEVKFVSDFGFGAIGFFGAVLAITVSAALFFSEIEHRTIHTLLAKPVTRGEFVLGKFSAVVAILTLFCISLTTLLAVMVSLRQVSVLHDGPGGIADAAGLRAIAVVAVGFGIWLKLIVLAAFTLLVGTFARTQLFTTVLGFAILVVGHLRFLVEAAADRSPDLRRAVARVAVAVFPDFQVFDLADSIRDGAGIVLSELGRVGLYGLGYTAAACAAALISFRLREL